MTDQPTCVVCGAALPTETNYCTTCGAPLSAGAPPYEMIPSGMYWLLMKVLLAAFVVSGVPVAIFLSGLYDPWQQAEDSGGYWVMGGLFGLAWMVWIGTVMALLGLLGLGLIQLGVRGLQRVVRNRA